MPVSDRKESRFCCSWLSTISGYPLLPEKKVFTSRKAMRVGYTQKAWMEGLSSIWRTLLVTRFCFIFKMKSDFPYTPTFIFLRFMGAEAQIGSSSPVTGGNCGGVISGFSSMSADCGGAEGQINIQERGCVARSTHCANSLAGVQSPQLWPVPMFEMEPTLWLFEQTFPCLCHCDESLVQFLEIHT